MLIILCVGRRRRLIDWTVLAHRILKEMRFGNSSRMF